MDPMVLASDVFAVFLVLAIIYACIKRSVKKGEWSPPSRPADFPPRTPAGPRQTTLIHCANCGCGIGKLETPMVWRNNIVCAACHEKLTRK